MYTWFIDPPLKIFVVSATMVNDPLTADQLARLKQASNLFLTQKDYGAVQLEALMDDIFGEYSTRARDPVACQWKDYWWELEIYAELEGTEKEKADIPAVSPCHNGQDSL